MYLFIYFIYFKDLKHIHLKYNTTSWIINTKIPVWFQEPILAGPTECHLHYIEHQIRESTIVRERGELLSRHT